MIGDIKTYPQDGKKPWPSRTTVEIKVEDAYWIQRRLIGNSARLWLFRDNGVEAINDCMNGETEPYKTLLILSNILHKITAMVDEMRRDRKRVEDVLRISQLTDLSIKEFRRLQAEGREKELGFS